MKKPQIILSLIAFILFLNVTANAQEVYDFKVKNAANEKDRTMMLDILRASLYQNYKQELIFEVQHFKVGGGYAWFRGNAVRKDGKQVRVGEYDDCCHVEALFTKRADKWYMETSSAFSSDVWYVGLTSKYPRAPRAIFDQSVLMAR
jgi:hypothetical protein